MLEFLRRSATSVFAWLILGVLALVFGLSFGLPSDSLKIGSDSYVTVRGESIGQQEYQYQMAVAKAFLPLPKDDKMAEMMGVKQEVLEGIIERQVLSDVAQDMGLQATVWDAETLTLSGQMIFFGETVDWLGDTKFNYDRFTKFFLRTLQTTEQNYLEVQRREILARTVRDLLAASVPVSEGELRRAYEDEANQLSLRYVRFEPVEYAQLVDPTADEIAAYVDAHTEELEKAYETQGARFTKLGKQARVRVLKVDLPGEDGDPAEAQKRIADATRRIRGGTDFRAVAREISDDTATARRGGEYGWASVEGTGSGLDPKVDEAVSSLEPGQVSGIVETADALYLVQLVDRREGDVPKEQALMELAEEAFKDEKGKELARRAADEALEALKGGKTLADLFETPDALDAPGEAIEAIEAAPSAQRGVVPSVETTGLFQKNAAIPGLGALPDLATAAWEADPKAEAIPQVFEAGTGFVIAGIERKESASDEGFAERRAELYDRLAQAKAGRTTAVWAMRECLEAKAKGEVVVAEDRVKSLTTYDRKDGEEAPNFKPYSVCERVGNKGGMLKFGMFAQSAGGTAR